MNPAIASLIHTLAWTLLHFLWQGCVLAAAFAVLMLALRRAAPAQRYLAGCITLGMMAAAPLATFMWLWRDVPPRPQSLLAPLTIVSGAPPALPPNEAMLAVVVVWLIGTLACSGWVLGGWLHTRRLHNLVETRSSHDLRPLLLDLSRRIGVTAVIRIVDHAAITAPITIGAIKPMILLPAAMLANLTPAHLEAILAHELAHVRRLDFLINLLQALLESLLFYHPAVWWVSHQVRLEREYCCDDIAAEVCGNRVTYARALTQLETLRSASVRLGLSSQGGSLMKRIVRLLGESGEPNRVRRPRLAPALAGLALFGAASAALALAQTPTQSPAETPAQAVVETAVLPTREMPLVMRWQMAANADEADQAGGFLPLMVAAGHATPSQPATPSVTVEDASGVWLLAGDLVEARAITAISLMRERRQAAPAYWLIAGEDASKQPPSEGLVKAAQFAYPFDLLSLMPWVQQPAPCQIVLDALAQPMWQRVRGAIAADHLIVVPRLTTAIEGRPGVCSLRLQVLLEGAQIQASGEAAVSLEADNVVFEWVPAVEEEATTVVEGQPIEVIVEEQPSETPER